MGVETNKQNHRRGRGRELKKRVTGDRKYDKPGEMGTGSEKHVAFLQSVILCRIVLLAH